METLIFAWVKWDMFIRYAKGYAIKTSTTAPYIRSVYLDILLFSTWINFSTSATLAMNSIKK